ncbi:diphthine synthase [Vanrija albida]|uniref:diphthine methyl ester synthase n=1 Tax=Vanrija albida TaxID=181172 RepID=A0ABR3PT76_9TREE
MLYVIGLGLSDEKDITVKGLEAVRKCERVYLEAYTSILMVEKERLEEFYGRPVITATRETVELEADAILADAQTKDIAFLVVGDPLGATTHTDLLLRADARGVPTQTIHNASIMTALGSTGLQMYNFGQSISLPFYTESWTPDSWYDRLEENLRFGMHTLVLLDIKVREQSEENMARGRLIYEPPRFMNPYQAFKQMLLTETKRRNPDVDSDDEDAAATLAAAAAAPRFLDPERTLAMSLSRIGTATQRIIAGTLAELEALDEEEFGAPLHSVVVVGKRIHPLELEFAGRWCVGGEQGKWWSVAKDVYGVERETFDY